MNNFPTFSPYSTTVRRPFLLSSLKNRINLRKENSYFFPAIPTAFFSWGKKSIHENFPLGAEKYTIRISKISTWMHRIKYSFKTAIFIEYEVNLIFPRFIHFVLSTFFQYVRNNNSNNHASVRISFNNPILAIDLNSSVQIESGSK